MYTADELAEFGSGELLEIAIGMGLYDAVPNAGVTFDGYLPGYPVTEASEVDCEAISAAILQAQA